MSRHSIWLGRAIAVGASVFLLQACAASRPLTPSDDLQIPMQQPSGNDHYTTRADELDNERSFIQSF